MHLPVLARLSAYPRLLLIGDPDRPLFAPVRRELGILAVLTPPIARRDLDAVVDALYTRCSESATQFTLVEAAR